MKKALIFLTIIFFSNLIGIYYGMYMTWWFDMSHHFLGGFFVSMLIFHYLSGVKTSSKLKDYLIIIGAVSFIGVVWEFAEYLASQTLIEPLYTHFGFRAYFIGDLDDTINDLLMDILGGFTFIFLRRK